MMMQTNETLRKMIDFNKAAYETTFKNMKLAQEQMEKAIHHYIDQSPGMSEEGKKAAKDWASMYKMGFDDVKTLIDDHYRKIGLFFQKKTEEPK
jgi:hypothetical protein